MSSTPTPRRRWIVVAVLAVILLGGLAWAGPWLVYRFTHSISKDAFVESHLINVAPQVSGTVVEVHVQEQQRVRKGQLLALIDPSTYQREADLSAAKLAVAEAALRKSEADLQLLIGEVPRRVAVADQRLNIAREDEVKANQTLAMVSRDVDEGVSAAKGLVEGAKAVMTLAEQDYERYGALARDGAVTQRRFQEATRGYGTAKADVQEAQAKLGQAEANRRQAAVAEQTLKSAKHSVAEAKASLELAKLGDLQIEAARQVVAERTRLVGEAKRSVELAQVNVGYTKVVAPYDGVVARKWRHVGDYARTGDALFSVYNPDLMYVTVQLEETLLEGVAPGNAAELYVDAYSKPFRGRVLWVGSATSANFSLIPRDISSGEFTYVVQRVPTRIAIERDERWSSLRPGLSVTAAIRHGSGDAEWAREALRQEAEIEGLGEKVP